MTGFLQRTKSTEKSFSLLLSCIFLLLTSTVSQHPIVGGHSPVKELNDTRVVAAAEFAFASFVNLTSSSLILPSITPEEPYSFSADLESYSQVVSASQQVVAGLNFNLVILVLRGGNTNSDDENSCLGSFSVTVYDRFGSLSITSWGEEYSCEEARSMLASEEVSEEPSVFVSEQLEPSEFESSVDPDETNPSNFKSSTGGVKLSLPVIYIMVAIFGKGMV